MGACCATVLGKFSNRDNKYFVDFYGRNNFKLETLKSLWSKTKMFSAFRWQHVLFEKLLDQPYLFRTKRSTQSHTETRTSKPFCFSLSIFMRLATFVLIILFFTESMKISSTVRLSTGL